MNETQLEAARYLINFAREVNYNDTRYAPKHVNWAADQLESYLND